MAGCFDGRVAIVTGGAAGIGAVTASAYAAEGATVVITDVDAGALEATARELGVHGVQADLAREQDVRRAMDGAIAEHGRIDVLVNLAGIYPFALVEDETFEGWRRIQAVNLGATFLCCQHALVHMRARGYGRIVNTSSGTVNNGQPGLASYVATKAGVIGLSRVLCREAGPDGVTVNVVMPGLVRTAHVLAMFGDAEATRAHLDDAIEHQSIKRNGEPEDIAHAILFLTEESSGWISGQTLQVDGGWSFT